MVVVQDGAIQKIVERHAGRRGALIPILQDIQDQLGYLPEPVLREVARRTGIPYSEVSGVVSFYSYFSTEPRGEHTVRVCLGTACYVRGGNDVLAAIRNELNVETGHTTDDRRFTLEIGRCFGACGLAPVVMIDDDVHQRVRPACIRELLANYAPNEDAPSLDSHAPPQGQDRREQEVRNG